jgi:hypothetical protein
MLRNVCIVLVLTALSATATLAAADAPAAAPAQRSSAARVAAHNRFPSAGLHHHAGANTLSHTRPRRRSVSSRTPASARRAHHRAASRRPSTRSVKARVSSSHRRSRVALRHVDSAAAARASSGPAVEAVSYPRRRYIAMPPPLRGSFESLERQNRRTENEGLERILDEKDLRNRISQRLLVPVPESASLAVNADLSRTHRYCRPWTARFLSDFAHAHAARFRNPLMVSSAVRTVEYQKQLILVNGNAAAAEGDVVSPHLTGSTVDIAKGAMSRQELAWVRAWLLPLQAAGKIDVEEEFQQSCFHITVYKAYVPSRRAPSQKPHRRKPLHDAELASRGR